MAKTMKPPAQRKPDVFPALEAHEVSALFVPRPLQKYAPYFIFILAVFAAYGNVYDNAFLYDDESLILKNVFLHDWHYLGSIFSKSITAGANIAGGFYRPLQILLYFLIYQLFGISTFAFHFFNVVLHAGNACLLYVLGRRLRFNATALLFATLIWTLHPVQVEAVTYMSGTADPLYAFFMLLGMIVAAPRFGPKQIAASIPFFILGLLSKEEAIVFPALAMTGFFLVNTERFQPRSYIRFWPLWVVAALYLIAHRYFLTFGDFHLHQQQDIYANSILCRIYTFLATLPAYLDFMVWPFHLHYDRNFPAVLTLWHTQVFAGIAVVALVATHIILGRSRRALALSWGVLWFAVAHILHTGIFMPINASLLEHWLYLPSAGLFIGIAQSLASIKWQRKKRKPCETTLFLLLVVFLGVLTYKQNTVWSDGENFYLNIFKNGEPSPHAHNNLAIIYTLDGRYQQALEQYELSIELSGDQNPQTQHDLAITLLIGPDGQRYTQEATKHLQRALEIDPNYYPADEALAELADRAGDKDKGDFYRHKAAEAHAKMIGS